MVRQLLVNESWTGRHFLLDLQDSDYQAIFENVSDTIGVPLSQLNFTQGSHPCSTSVDLSITLQVSLSMNGGKGGFGSLLRSMNPKKNLADNYESCRDLSGRRLRTVYNE